MSFSQLEYFTAPGISAILTMWQGSPHLSLTIDPHNLRPPRAPRGEIPGCELEVLLGGACQGVPCAGHPLLYRLPFPLLQLQSGSWTGRCDFPHGLDFQQARSCYYRVCLAAQRNQTTE